MSYAEALDWIVYIEKHGRPDLGMRIEQGFALVAFQLQQLINSKLKNPQPAEFSDFLIHKPPQQDASIEDVFSLLSNVAKKGK